MSMGYTYVMSDIHGDFTAFNLMLRQLTLSWNSLRERL